MDALKHETEICHLVYVKSRNQHRTQVWWKYFAIMHRRLRQIVEAKKIYPTIAKYLVQKLIPKAYNYFHGMLAQGAFISLGFYLIGMTARVYTILEPLTREFQCRPVTNLTDARKKNVSSMMRFADNSLPLHPDSSEIINMHDTVGTSDAVPYTNKKKKPKKEKDPIDEIFDSQYF